MRDSWTGYEEKTEARCEYCGCTRDDVYYIGGDCCCGVEWKIECSNGVELEVEVNWDELARIDNTGYTYRGYNNIDNALEEKRARGWICRDM